MIHAAWYSEELFLFYDKKTFSKKKICSQSPSNEFLFTFTHNASFFDEGTWKTPRLAAILDFNELERLGMNKANYGQQPCHCRLGESRILNGRTKGDSLGRITFNGFQGFSTVDYIIVSQNLYKSFDSFIVKQPSPLSDHSQLIGWLNISRPVKIACLNNTELQSLQLQFLWKEDSNIKFSDALDSPEVSYLINQFNIRDFQYTFDDVNEAVLEFNHIIESAAKTSLQLSKTKSKKNKDSQVWFDNECKSVRKLHKKLSNRLHKAPLDIYLRQRYNDINKTYKSLLRRKKQKFYNDQIDTLVNEKDSKQFWSNLKSLKNNNGNQKHPPYSSKRTFYTLQQSTFIG